MSTPLSLIPGTNNLPAGDFSWPAGKTFPAGAIVNGVRGQTRLMMTPDNSGVGAYILDSTTVQNVVVDGAGFKPTKPSGRPSNITLDNIIFNNVAKECVNIESGLSHSKITNCSANKPKSFFVYGYNWDNVLIANNELFACGIHIDEYGLVTANAGNIVEQNYGEGIDGVFIELQGPDSGLIVQDNDYAKPTTVANGSKYAYSAPVDTSVNTIVRRNRAIMLTLAQQPLPGNTLIVFELGGQNLLAEDNYSNGGNDVCAVNGTGATGNVRNNRFANYNHMTGNNTSNKANATIANNGPAVVLTWDITRDRPRPNVRYGIFSPPAGGGGSSTPPPVISIDPAAYAALQASNAQLTASLNAANATIATARGLSSQMQATLK